MLVRFAEQGLAEPDPWTGLVFFLEQGATGSPGTAACGRS